MQIESFGIVEILMIFQEKYYYVIYPRVCLFTFMFVIHSMVSLPCLHVGYGTFQEPLAKQVLKLLPTNMYLESHEKEIFVPTE